MESSHEGRQFHSSMQRKRKLTVEHKSEKKLKLNPLEHPPYVSRIEKNFHSKRHCREIGFNQHSRKEDDLYIDSDFWIRKVEQDLESTLYGHGGCVNCACWDHRGRLLASGSDDQTVRVWDPFIEVEQRRCISDRKSCARGKELSVLHGPNSNVFGCRFMHHSWSGSKQNYIAAAGNDANVYVWNWEASSSPERIFRHHSRKIVSVDVHPDWPYCILTCSSDGTVRKFDLRCSYQDESQNHDHEIGMVIPQQYMGGPVSRRGDFKETLVVNLCRADRNIEVMSANWNPMNGNEFVTCSSDGFARIFDFRQLNARSREDCIAEFRNLQISSPSALRPTWAAYSPNGTHVLTSNLNGSMYEFDVEEMKTKFQTQRCEEMQDAETKDTDTIQSEEIPFQPDSPPHFHEENSERSDDPLHLALRESNDLDLSSYLDSVFVQDRDDSDSDFSEDSSHLDYHIPSRELVAILTGEDRPEFRQTSRYQQQELAILLANMERTNEMEVTRDTNRHVNGNKEGTFRQSYTGHVHDKTLKSCTYWGHNHVMTGSDDDRIYVYDRETGKIANILDRTKDHSTERNVINNLVPHPYLPLIAGIGLSDDIHFWTPTAMRYDRHEQFENSIRRTSAYGYPERVNMDLLGPFV